MSTIRTAIVQSAQANGLGSYLSEAEPIIADLEAAVEKVAEGIREAARETGISASLVEDTLINVGLVERPAPEPEPEFSVTGTDEDDRLARLERQVSDLVALAERHLGSRI